MSFEYDNENEEGEITCDKCCQQFVTVGSFRECIEDAKAELWRVVYDEVLKAYFHYCPECK